MQAQAKSLAAVEYLDIERIEAVKPERLHGRLLGGIPSGEVLGRLDLLLGVGDLALMEELSAQRRIALKPLGKLARIDEVDADQWGQAAP